MNLDSRKLVPGTQLPATIPPVITPIAFSATDPTTYNSSTSVAVFDSLGNSHVVQSFFVKRDNAALAPTLPVTIELDFFATVLKKFGEQFYE